jgi:hypothetical protein
MGKEAWSARGSLVPWRDYGDQSGVVRRELYSMTRDQELWGVALWVETTHGAAGPAHIAGQITRLAKDGDEQGIAMWRAVADRYDQLVAKGALN